MKRLMKERAGSALLIVLGMLSFMVVSAVGFSIYMRTSRAPSSHLRRESTARYLLKSALANAISRIDGELSDNSYVEGVYTDIYPGVGPAQKLMDWQNGDLWTHRVFTPFGLTNSASTVSTLTLEGLAYLPPAIINEVRVYSRLSRTAAWKNLSYDLGRYAFTAVDVSDCFDINRLRANERRTSAPGMQVNLSSLFDSNGSALDTILNLDRTVPLTSLADFNLVGGGPFTPFAEYIGTSGGSIYNSGDASYVSNALFIVDTWFPPTNAVGTAQVAETFDISDNYIDNQPFKAYNAKSALYVSTAGSTQLGLALQKYLGIGMACLYDYLDADQVPISLALPTVETAPMICGIGLVSAGSSQISPKVESVDDQKFTYEKKNGDETHTIQRTITKTVFKGMGVDTLMLTGLAAYPFKRVDSGRKGSFRVEALAAVFMADSGVSCRLIEGSAIRPTNNDWLDASPRDGILWFKGSTQLSFPDDIAKTTDALKGFSIPLKAASTGSECPLYFEIADVDVTEQDDNGEPAHLTFAPFKTMDSTQEGDAFVVYDTAGKKVEWKTLFSASAYQKVILGKAELEGGQEQNKGDFTSSTEYRPTVAVWVRVVNGNDTVDLVPAVARDDADFLPGESSTQSILTDPLDGGGVPILDFVTDKTFTYNDTGLKALDGSVANYVDWTELYAADPRFNFAPEDWFGKKENAGDVSQGTTWLQAVGADASTGSGGVFGSSGRDPDIFMFTSDQEYLQSIGELAFLPNLQELNGTAEMFSKGEFNDKSRYHGNNNFNSRTWSGVANASYIWRTYTPVDRGNGYDPIYELQVNNKPIISGSGDFRANPFSPDTRVLASVVKDTPYDYYVASTNDELTVLSRTAKVSEARKYAFGPDSSMASARWEDDEIEEISDRLGAGFREKARTGSSDDWMGIYDGLAWYEGGTGDNQLSFLGSSDLNEPLHGVDRKFLYSFWRECFQNRQQLFLVFIRAEPLTVGGSSGDAISNSQLGARGVALVWRDPLPAVRTGSKSGQGTTSRQMSRSTWQDLLKENGPHRTRVLFYHQFD